MALETRLLNPNHKTTPLQKPRPAIETHQSANAKHFLRAVTAEAIRCNNQDWTLSVVPRKLRRRRLGNHEACLQDPGGHEKMELETPPTYSHVWGGRTRARLGRHGNPRSHCPICRPLRHRGSGGKLVPAHFCGGYSNASSV